jgi:uncharacterized circularly permuted ATP-grasp superfamily protein
VPGLIDVYRAGGVTLCSAPGAGVADDKAIYTLRARHDPLLSRAETHPRRTYPHGGARSDDCKYVLEHLDELVVKEVHGSGGYGMLIGPKSTKGERDAFAERIKAHPSPSSSPSRRSSFRPRRSSASPRSRRAMSISARSASSAARSGSCRAG